MTTIDRFILSTVAAVAAFTLSNCATAPSATGQTEGDKPGAACCAKPGASCCATQASACCTAPGVKKKG